MPIDGVKSFQILFLWTIQQFLTLKSSICSSADHSFIWLTACCEAMMDDLCILIASSVVMCQGSSLFMVCFVVQRTGSDLSRLCSSQVVSHASQTGETFSYASHYQTWRSWAVPRYGDHVTNDNSNQTGYMASCCQSVDCDWLNSLYNNLVDSCYWLTELLTHLHRGCCECYHP